MHIDTVRFGTFELKDSRIIEFPLGLPGFEGLSKFIIIQVKETKPIYWLQSTENKYIALPVIIPFEILDDYYVQIRDNELEELKVESQNDLIIMNVVVIPEDITKMTANLASPIVINAKFGVGRQIIVDAAELPIRYPIYEAVMKSLKGGEAHVGALEKKR